jgi:hypothetical protein
LLRKTPRRRRSLRPPTAHYYTLEKKQRVKYLTPKPLYFYPNTPKKGKNSPPVATLNNHYLETHGFPNMRKRDEELREWAKRQEILHGTSWTAVYQTVRTVA